MEKMSGNGFGGVRGVDHSKRMANAGASLPTSYVRLFYVGRLKPRPVDATGVLSNRQILTTTDPMVWDDCNQVS